MRFRKFGHTDFEVSVVGQGTWNLETYDRKIAIQAFHCGMELGMTHIDTAYDYGNGAAEEFVGEALSDRRNQAFLVSKVLPAVANFKGTIAACEGSLKRLKTDYLDCFLLHWWENNALEETLEAFIQLKKSGKIRSFGLSNLSLDELKQAVDMVGPNQLACHQVVYNIQSRDIEKEMLDWCNQQAIAVVGYAPYGDVRAPSTLFSETLKIGGAAIERIAQNHQVSTRNVVLAFLLSHDVYVIPKGERPEFAEDNAKAAELILSEDELRELDQLFPVPEDRPLPFTNAYYDSQ
ncbi:MAG: aldo/keto reductase [Myxococcota bacterium]|nr:aldo/keto reductase [Myxococcota bacterium]